jgi:hypothetical protein
VDIFGPGYGPVASCYELVGFMKGREFVDWLRDH